MSQGPVVSRSDPVSDRLTCIENKLDYLITLVTGLTMDANSRAENALEIEDAMVGLWRSKNGDGPGGYPYPYTRDEADALYDEAAREQEEELKL